MVITTFCPALFTGSTLLSFQVGFLHSSGTVNLSGNFFHATSGTIESQAYQSFLVQAKAAFNAFGTGSFTFTFDESSGYTIKNSTQPFSATFLNTASANMFGFSDVNITFSRSAGINLTSSFRPPYIWRSRYNAKSNQKLPYEPRTVSYGAESKDGRQYSITKPSSAIYSDWRYSFELLNNVRSNAALASAPFVFENWIKYSRGDKPNLEFTSAVVTANGNEFPLSVCQLAYKFRNEATNFNPISREDNQAEWHLDIKAIVIPSGSIT